MTSPPPSPLPRFALGVLVILPALMLLWWYGVRGPLLEVLAWLMDHTTAALLEHHIIGMVVHEDTMRFKTTLPLLEQPLALAAIDLPASRFTVAFPLLWGLIIATPGAARPRQLLWGTAILVPAVLLMLLMFLQFQLGLYINHQSAVAVQPPDYYVAALPYPGWAFHLMAVGRQLAVLVLPTLVPLLLWGTFNRALLARLIEQGSFLIGRSRVREAGR